MKILQKFTLHVTPKQVRDCFLFAVLPALLFFTGALVLLRYAGFTLPEILRDPAQKTHVSSFIGFLSNIGVWLWVSAAAITFTAVYRNALQGGVSNQKLTILLGCLSLLLAIDDFFMLHDRYINQLICYAVYAGIAGLLLFRYFSEIMVSAGTAFLLACLFLALSILSDLLKFRIPLSYVHAEVMEEGFKFMGAATWLFFNVRFTSRKQVA